MLANFYARSAAPVRGKGVFGYPFSLVPSHFPLPLGPQKSPQGLLKSQKSIYFPALNCVLVSDPFLTSFWVHFEIDFETILRTHTWKNLSRKPMSKKLKIFNFPSVFQWFLKVGHLGTRPKSIKNLSQRSLFPVTKNDSNINRSWHQKWPQHRP